MLDGVSGGRGAVVRRRRGAAAVAGVVGRGVMAAAAGVVARVMAARLGVVSTIVTVGAHGISVTGPTSVASASAFESTKRTAPRPAPAARSSSAGW